MCVEKEKNKGCLYLTPKALEKTVEIEIDNPVKEEVTTDQSIATRPEQTGINVHSNVLSGSSKQSLSDSNISGNCDENSDITDNDVPIAQLNQTSYNSKVSIDSSPALPQENDKFKSEQNSVQNTVFTDCMASVNQGDLKMLSFLDFAGQSAYYACHHIFYSPRAFFVLVVDMTKELNSLATEACMRKEKEFLIYSNWTYAGKLTISSHSNVETFICNIS